jgi:hypothetical protein
MLGKLLCLLSFHHWRIARMTTASHTLRARGAERRATIRPSAVCLGKNARGDRAFAPGRPRSTRVVGDPAQSAPGDTGAVPLRPALAGDLLETVADEARPKGFEPPTS